MTVEEDIRRFIAQEREVGDRRAAEPTTVALYYGELRWLVENGVLAHLTGARLLAHPGEVEELRAEGLLP